MEYAKNIDDFNRGDKIKIHSLDDPFLNIDYRGKEGEVKSIDYSDNTLRGSWGDFQIYPEYDDVEITYSCPLKPIS